MATATEGQADALVLGGEVLVELKPREDAVEAAWTVVDPVLETHHRSHPYQPGTWGPEL